MNKLLPSPAELRSTFKKVITPADTEYDAARAVFYGGIDRHPAFIIQAVDTGEVVRALELARTTGLELAVRSGGHSLAGHSVSEGGIVLDLRDMRRLEINADDRTAWVEPGLTSGEYSAAADKYGLATGFGDTGSVGIGGIALGGGIGYLVRKFGMTIDNLLAAELVTANGQVLQVDAAHHPDLFWAVRGGGGNFGVATRFKLKLHQLGQVLGGVLMLPATPEVIAGFMSFAAQAPDELSAIVNIMPAMPMPMVPPAYRGKILVMALMMYAGSPEAGRSVVAPFRELATPIADMLRPMRYPGIYFPEDKSYHPTAVTRTMFMKTVDLPAARYIVERLNTSDAAMRAVQLRVLGGAMARVPADATAFAYRTSPILANIAAFYDNDKNKAIRESWVQETAQSLYQGAPGAYVGFIGDEGPQRVHDAYPEATWNKLSAIKAKYDPDNLFRLNQNIPPQR